jgi:Na+/proline symporter
VVKLLVGFLKGAVIGGAVGYGAYALAQATGFESAWLTYGVVGALVGLFVGRPLWSLIRDKDATTVVAILKAAFGFGIGCGLYALLAKAWNPSAIAIGTVTKNVFAFPPVVGAAVGGVYGAFVELDDAVGDDAKDKAKAGKQPEAAKPAKGKAKK